MARPRTGRPTDLELEVLKIIWERGPSTVREVWEMVAKDRDVVLTSVLKIMQIMRDKGLLVADESCRPQIFRTARRQNTVLKLLARDLVDRAFNGSTRNLLLHALDPNNITPEEMAEIRELLNEIEGEK